VNEIGFEAADSENIHYVTIYVACIFAVYILAVSQMKDWSPRRKLYVNLCMIYSNYSLAKEDEIGVIDTDFQEAGFSYFEKKSFSHVLCHVFQFFKQMQLEIIAQHAMGLPLAAVLKL
jgi:hypothetical protein